MNGTIAIARRELAERRSFFVTAAILAVIPFAVLLLPDIRRFGTQAVIAATGGFVAVSFLAGLALLLGASFIGRDLSDKRLSFYFARPVTGSAIWFGKLAGGLATLFLCGAVILVPSMIASTEHWTRIGRGTALLALIVAGLFLLSHTVGTMFRSRSPLILADTACAAIAAAALYAMFNALAKGHAHNLRAWIAAVLVVLLFGTLIAAGAWQVSRGRIDVLRSHRELSRFLWSAVAATLAILGLYVVWVVSVTPEDLGETVWATQPPAGKWVMVGGPMKNRGDYNAGFYVNVTNGAYERANARSIWWQTFFTRDGRVAGQLRPIDSRGKGPVQLDLVRFGGTDVEVTPTEVTFPERTYPVMDDAGTRVAAVTGGLVTVQSLPEGRTLAAARLPRASQYARVLFTGDERVRIYAQDERRLDVYELDVRARRLEHTGTREGMAYFNANADASRLLATAGPKMLVLDGRTAAVLATLPGPGQGLILSDGRVAVIDSAGTKLSIYGGDYVLQREVPLPGLRNILLLREVEGGTLLVGGHRERIAEESDGRGWNVYVVDPAKGAVVRTGRDLRSITAHPRDPRRNPADADMPFVFLDRRGAIVLWDAADGSRRAVTRASASLPDALLAAALHLQSFDECENPPG